MNTVDVAHPCEAKTRRDLSYTQRARAPKHAQAGRAANMMPSQTDRLRPKAAFLIVPQQSERTVKPLVLRSPGNQFPINSYACSVDRTFGIRSTLIPTLTSKHNVCPTKASQL